MSGSKTKLYGIIVGIIVLILIVVGIILLQKPIDTGGASNDSFDQSDNTLIPDASIQPDLNYLRDQIFHPVGGGG
jgi:hypothetical protein